VKPLFTTTTVDMTVQGTAYSLINYLAQLKETAMNGLIVNTVGITRADTLSNLQMNFSLYTSPYAPPRTIPALAPQPIPIGTPVPIPTVTPSGPTLSPEAQLAQPLDSLWTAQNWPEVIRIIEQIRAINPNYDDMTNKLYAAHVNYGYQLQAAGDLEGARREFVNALAVKPDGGEAAAALRALTTPTAPTTYVVQPGDTLFSIARRFGLTLQQLMQANNLTSFGILVGQQLIIPPP
jgi:nucleoid-associated protein YgaU